ncbi:MAG: cell envelope integrity protein TolA [Sulfuriflexus sp.]|nr:cell envelope integrity protein TolA [Sulfuriflexus sp.]
MKEVIRNNLAAIIFSVAVHAILLSLLVFSFDWKPEKKSLVIKENVIKAVAVDANKVKAELDKLKRADDRSKKKEKDRVAKLKREEKKLRKKRTAEEKKLAKLKKKRKAEEKKRKAEQKKLTKLKKQQAALKKKQQAEVKKRKAEKVRQAKLKKKQDALKKKQDAIKKKQALAKKKRETEKKQRQKDLAQQLAAEEKAQADELATREIDKYQVLIRQKIERKWLKPPGNLKGLQCVVAVRLIPGGGVVDASITTTSGNLIFDRSAERAVRKASPLPLPKNSAIAAQLYNFNFLFKAE